MNNQEGSAYNKSLYWYGIFARVKIIFGKLFMVAALGIFLYSILQRDYFIYWIFVTISFVLGIIVFFKGKSQFFDYKRRSGYIIYGKESM